MTKMDINWNVARISDTNPDYFFTPGSYAQYSVNPSFIPAFYMANAENPLDTSGSNLQKDISVTNVGIAAEPVFCEKKTSKTVKAVARTPPKNQAPQDMKNMKWLQARMGLKVPFPYPSTMTKHEQKTYLELYDRFRHQPPSMPQDNKLLGQMKELQVKVTAEQEEYMAYLENVARQRLADYNVVYPVVEKFVKEYLEKRRKRVFQYPRYYILHDTISMTLSKTQQEPLMTHVNTLLEMGTVHKLILPHLSDSSGNVTKVPMDYNKVSKQYPQHEAEENSKPPISNDPVIDRLSAKYDAEILMSFAAFQCLLDNNPPGYGRQWEMAVTVKEINVDGGRGSRKVVCIDSPFIPKALTPQEKNLIFHKFSLKTLLLHPNHLNICHLEENFGSQNGNKKPNGEPDCAFAENMFGDSTDDLSSLEVFGTDAHKNTNKQTLLSDLISSSSDSDMDIGESIAVGQSDDVKPESPIPCLDGMVDEKPEEDLQEDEKTNDQCVSRVRRSSRCLASPKKAVNNLPSGDTVGLRRSSRLASRSRHPEPELTDSGSDDNLVIDFSSPNISNQSFTCETSKAFKQAQDDFEDCETNDHCMNRGNKITDSDLSESESHNLLTFDETSSNINTNSASQLSEKLKETGEKLDESGLILTCSSSASVCALTEVQERLALVKESDNLAVIDNEVDDLIMDETIGQNRIILNKKQRKKSDHLLVKCKGKRKQLSETCSSNQNPEASSSNLTATRRKRGRPQKVKVEQIKDEVNKKLTNEEVKLAQTTVDCDNDREEIINYSGVNEQKTDGEDGIEGSSETKVKPMQLTGPYEQTSMESLPIKSGCRLTAKEQNIEHTVSSATSAADAAFGPTAAHSFLDQILTEQSRMFDKTNTKLMSSLWSGSQWPTATVDGASSQMRSSGSVSQGKIFMTADASGDHSKEIPPASETMSEDPADYDPVSTGNVAYHLWGLGGLKLIIRYNYHGIYRPYHHKQPYFVHIAPKLEYQAEHGVEQMTASEILRGWAATSFKQRTRLIRAHINAFSSEVFLIENLDQNQITKGLLNPSAYLVPLQSLLERLTKLAVGSYLIGHVPGSQHIQIKKMTQTNRGVYDLHLAYQSTEMVLNQSTSTCWIPIDKSIRLRYHNKFCRIPCTFEPKDTALVNTVQKVTFRKNVNKKKKKKS